MRLGVDARVLAHTPTGVARYLSALLAEYPTERRAGEILELFADRPLADDAAPPGALRDGRVTVLRWPLPGGDAAWRQVRLAAHLAVRGRLDVLFCPFYTVPLATRVPRVVTIHDVSFLAHPEWFSRRARLAFALAGPSARAARRVLTVSRFSASEIASRLGIPARRIEVVPPGIAERWSRPVGDAERAALRGWLGYAGPYLLHLGAVHRRRNVGALLDAFARLAPSHPDLTLVVAGPSLDASIDVPRVVRERGLEGRVLRREWVPEERLRALLAEAAALVYLSSYEGFGLPALEAMATGAPVVALRRASLPEVLGDAAAYVESLDPVRVAAAVDRLLRDPSWVGELRRLGAARAASFTTRDAARRTFDILRDVAEAR